MVSVPAEVKRTGRVESPGPRKPAAKTCAEQEAEAEDAEHLQNEDAEGTESEQVTPQEEVEKPVQKPLAQEKLEACGVPPEGDAGSQVERRADGLATFACRFVALLVFVVTLGGAVRRLAKFCSSTVKASFGALASVARKTVGRLARKPQAVESEEPSKEEPSKEEPSKEKVA